MVNDNFLYTEFLSFHVLVIVWVLIVHKFYVFVYGRINLQRSGAALFFKLSKRYRISLLC